MNQAWWTIQTSATLQSVATQNYACFGRGGVPHFGTSAKSTASNIAPDTAIRDTATLCVELIIRAPDSPAPGGIIQDSPIRLANLDITLTPQEQTAQRVIWSGYDAAQHMQIVWVWDFFRLLSHVVVRVADPHTETDPDPAWKIACDGIRASVPGDVVALNVRSACGDIHQTHSLTGPAIRWEPA